MHNINSKNLQYIVLYVSYTHIYIYAKLQEVQYIV